MLIADFGINLAAALAYDLLKALGGRLRDLAFGPPEVRALERVYTAAFEALLRELAAELGCESSDVPDIALREYVNDPDVADLLLDLALGEREVSMVELRRRFDEQYDRATLSLDFNRAMAQFVQVLARALDDEAAQPGSLLYNRVSLAHLKELRRGLARPRFTAPHQAPPLPPYFVDRPEVLTAVKRQLLAAAPAGVLVVSALHGLGGIGKSVLGAALSQDPEVQAQLPDGVLWVTLGQQPDVLSVLLGWVQALGDYDYRPTMAAAATTHLRTLLHDRACLLVVDDAWQSAHARAFLVGGPLCRVLLTTREALLARAVDATLYRLDVLTPPQARALLVGRLGRNLAPAEEGPAAELAVAVGYLPLALELAAAQVAEGIGWGELVSELRAEIGRLAALEFPGAAAEPDEATRKRLSLRASFQLSLGRLSATRRECFAWLGVLPEDAAITAGMTAVLWGTDERGARDILRLLADKALLTPVPAGGCLPTYRLHDLLHDFAGMVLTTSPEQGGLGRTLPVAHRELLDRYRARTVGGLWHTLPADGYIHTYLAWHLEQAGWVEELHALLREETAEGRNAWYEARERLGQTAGFLADARRAWRLVCTIGLGCRYALVQASLNSLAGNIPPALLAALVGKGIWTPIQGLAYARAMPEPAQRAGAIAILSTQLQEPDKTIAVNEALSSTLRITKSLVQARALVAIAPHLPVALLESVLDAALALPDRAGLIDSPRGEALKGLASHLPPSLAERAKDEVTQISDNRSRAVALVGLAPQVAKWGDANRALALCESIGEDPLRARALAGVIAHLPLEILGGAQLIGSRIVEWYRPTVAEAIATRLTSLGDTNQALTEVQQCTSELERSTGLIGIARHVSRDAIDQALAAAETISDGSLRARSLAALALRLVELGLVEQGLSTIHRLGKSVRSDTLLNASQHLAKVGDYPAALSVARGIERPENRMQALALVATYAPESERLGVFREALAAVEDSAWRSLAESIWAELAPLLPKELLAETLLFVQHAADKDIQSKAIATLSAYLPVSEREQALEYSLQLALQVEDDWSRNNVLEGIIPQLPERLLDRVLDAIRSGASSDLSDNLLLRLGPYLSVEQLRGVVEMVKELADERQRSRLLQYVGIRLADLDQVQEALSLALSIPDDENRALALAQIAPRLGGAKQGQIYQMAVESAGKIPPELRASALVQVALYVPPDHFEELLKKATEIMYETERGRALVGLADAFPQHIAEISEEVRRIGDPNCQGEAWAELGVRLSPEERSLFLQEAFTAVLDMSDIGRCTTTIGRLIPLLPDEFYPELIAVAKTLPEVFLGHTPHDLPRCPGAEILACLAPYLSREMVAGLLDWARGLGDPGSRAEALDSISPYLSDDEERIVVYREAFEALQEVGNGRHRGRLLAELAPKLPFPLLEEALMLAKDLPEVTLYESPRGEAQTALALAMASAGGRALIVAQNIEDEPFRSAVLTELALQLFERGYTEEAVAATRSIISADTRGQVLTRLAKVVAAQMSTDPTPAHIVWMEALWEEVLPVLAAHSRRDILSDLSALVPLIAALGGVAVIREIVQAILDVGRWWP